jgi:hypothetical protein
MHRLIVNPDTESAWEIPLHTGVVSLGRGQENNFSIEHESVSAAHCLFTVMDSGVTIKDLGSIGGTYVNGSSVEEMLLLPGQTLRLGEVLLRYESDVLPAPVQSQTSNAIQNQACKFHPKSIARFQCPTCGNVFCDLCVNRRSHRGAMRGFCRACGEECSPIHPVLDPQQQPKPFAKQIGGAFTYPFKSDGIILLVAGTIFYAVVSYLAAHAMMAGLLLMIFGTGYLISYYQRILQSSAIGENEMPDWPDFTNFSDLASPIFQAFGTILISFGPAILLRIFVQEESAWREWAIAGGMIFGCLYFPLAFTAVTMADSLGGLNPLVIIPSILKIPGEYLLVVLLSVGIYFAETFGNALLGSVLPIPILPTLISQFLGLYLGVVEMRLLGLLYWTKRADLGWFSR